MLQVFKRIEKSLDNPYGVISVQKLEELNGPFLICLSAQDMHEKSVFGMIRTGAVAARVNTSEEFGAKFKIDEFPVHFLGMRFEKDDTYKRNFEEIVDKMIYPYLIGDGTKTIDEMKKLARRINFITYCDGTLTYQNIERRLGGKLQNAGYSESDIKDVLSQISLVAIGTMVYTGNLNATSATFIDLNDSEIYTSRTDGHKEILRKKQVDSICGKLKNPNNLLYIFNGSGNHSLREYFLDNNIAKPAISAVLTSFLENSVANELSEELMSISPTEVLSRLKKYGDARKNPVSLLGELDESLSYGGAPRYTQSEARLRHELDISYSALQRTRVQLESSEAEKNKKTESLKSVVEGLREYCSETTFYQILCSAKMWQIPSDRDIFSEPSDKDIRQAYERLLLEEKKDKSGEGGPKL